MIYVFLATPFYGHANMAAHYSGNSKVKPGLMDSCHSHQKWHENNRQLPVMPIYPAAFPGDDPGECDYGESPPV